MQFNNVRLITRTAALFFVAALAATHAVAQTVVFDNGNPDLVTSFASDPGRTIFTAEDFTFETTTTFNAVRWYGLYGSGNTPTTPDLFTISFFDTTEGALNAAPRTGEVFAIGNPNRVDTGTDLSGFDIYQYEATLTAPITVVAGAYGISIVNDTTADTDDDWGWAGSGTTGNFFFRNAPNTGFASENGSLAFQLINGAPAVVPEAGSLALLLPALGVLGVVVRRRK